MSSQERGSTLPLLTGTLGGNVRLGMDRDQETGNGKSGGCNLGDGCFERCDVITAHCPVRGVILSHCLVVTVNIRGNVHWSRVVVPIERG